MAPGTFLRGFVALVAILLSASSVAAAETPKRGGVLRVGNLGEPPALDAHWTTASITETLTNHVYEGLYSLDASNRPTPMLAESHTVSKDGLTYTFKVRQGIKFHNGKEMTSEDVVPSLARWGKQSLYGKALFAQLAAWRAAASTSTGRVTSSPTATAAARPPRSTRSAGSRCRKWRRASRRWRRASSSSRTTSTSTPTSA